MIDKIRNKITNNKGFEKQILVYIIISFSILYLYILIIAYQIYDYKYEYIDDVVEIAKNLAVKKGMINTDIDLFLKNKIDKLGDFTYIYKYTPFDEINMDGIIPKYDLAVNQKLKTGDIIYIKIKSNYETMYSKLLNIKFLGLANPNEKHYYLIVNEGMVEADAE